VSKPFGELAEQIVANLPRNPERTVALRRLGSQNQTSLALKMAVEQLRTEAAARGAP